MKLRSGNAKTTNDSTQSVSKIPKAILGPISLKPPGKMSPVQSKQQTVTDHDVLNVGKMVCTAMNEVMSLRNAFETLQKSVEHSINSMSDTINAKGNHYMDITDSLQREINSIKKSLQINSEVSVLSNTVSMDTRLNYILHGNALMQTEYEYAAQLEQLRNKVNKIEESNEQVAETVNDLVTSISCFMSTDSKEHQQSTDTEKIIDIENAVECIQHEIDRIKTSSIEDGEKVIKMNKQIHVLSAKYVDFNIKPGWETVG